MDNLPVLANGSAGDADLNPTIRQLVDLYEKFALPKLAPSSQQLLHATLVEFAARFGAMRVRSLHRLHVEEWIASHHDWRSGWTRKRIIAQVKRVFNWAWSMEFIDRNPLRYLTESAPGPGRPITDFEFRTMLKAVTADFRLILLFLKTTGCRPGELRELLWEHIDWQRRVAVLPYHKTHRKTRKPRIIALSGIALKILAYRWRRTPEGMREHIRVLAESEKSAAKLSRLLPARVCAKQNFVFLNRSGRPWTKSAINLRWFRAAKAAGVPKNAKLYGLRHAFVSQALRQGVPIKTVSHLVGHESVRMTEYYSHIYGDLEHLVDAADQANRVQPRKGGPQP